MNFQPYLSVVATTRNDNHGGDLNHRTQVFIDSLSSQAEKHKVPIELVLVEWNPPVDRPNLKDVFTWPKNEFLKIKIVTVPREIHQKFIYSEKLPLYQMIAKNVGIRRASAPFILATNIDIILSDELFSNFSKRTLKAGVLYRCDRVDVDRHVPQAASIEEKLKYCQENVLRISKRGEMWILERNAAARTVKNCKPFIPAQDWKGEPSEKLIFIRNFLISNLRSSVYFIEGLILFRKGTKENSLLRRYFRPTFKKIVANRNLNFINFMSSICYNYIDLKKYSVSISPKLLWANWFFDSKIPRWHYNACGDFTLMDKDSWSLTRGSPEIEAYSMHIDSLTLMVAASVGIQQHEFNENEVIYHIEHGGGWTPEQNYALYRSMVKRGIRILSYQEHILIGAEIMQRKNNYLNGVNWGLNDLNLLMVEAN